VKKPAKNSEGGMRRQKEHVLPLPLLLDAGSRLLKSFSRILHFSLFLFFTLNASFFIFLKHFLRQLEGIHCRWHAGIKRDVGKNFDDLLFAQTHVEPVSNVSL
jgi:hypothetical protein